MCSCASRDTEKIGYSHLGIRRAPFLAIHAAYLSFIGPFSDHMICTYFSKYALIGATTVGQNWWHPADDGKVNKINIGVTTCVRHIL